MSNTTPNDSNPKPDDSRRRWWIWITGGVVVVVVLAFGLPWAYVTFLAPDAPAPFVSQEVPTPQASAATEPSSSSLAATPLATELAAGTWIVADGSQAGYRVQEVLNGQDTTVVGRTSQVAGSLTASDNEVAAATIEVDTASVATDSGARDSQYRSMVMDTDRYPTATFALTQPFAFSQAGGTADIVGDLTLHGVTAPVTATVAYAGSLAGGVTVVGQIPITFSDWDITAPSLGFVKVESSGVIEFSLVLDHEGESH